MSDTVLDRIGLALERATLYDPNAVTAPIALLWPDETRQWEPMIAELRKRHRIVSFGAFDGAKGQGPAYWLRCVIASTVDVEGVPEGLPVIYLPGVSRDTLRSLDDVAAELAPLSALQHRCQWFSHPNGKGWTVRALLSNKGKGLGLNIATDEATSTALLRSLVLLAGERWSRLESKHIDAGFLNALLNPDPVRALLDWLDDPAGLRRRLGEGGWRAFVQQCQHEFNFDPTASGEIEGARRLGEAEGAWKQVWQRFRENPADYPRIPERLRIARPDMLFTNGNEAWPQDNEASEDKLRTGLLDMAAATPSGARKDLTRFEAQHGIRRKSVWAQLGKTPLANSLEYLAELAMLTSTGLPGTSVEEIAEWYASTGWRADRAMIRALAEVQVKADVAAVTAAVTAAYQPWLDSVAKALQSAVGSAANAGTYIATPAPSPSAGEVVVFVDGLRLDVAHMLVDRLQGAGLETDVAHTFAALPTVTQTAKPVLVPIDPDRLTAGSGLAARRAPDGPDANVAVLRSLMGEAKVQVLLNDDVGDPAGVAWTETGQLDSRGHALGAELVHEIDDQVQRIATRIQELLDAGWVRVTIVTDHGWILLPGGLPKNEDLPVAVTDTKKGRCARVKGDLAKVSVPTVPWHWNRDIRIAIAPGVSCFEANQTYEHGGVSPQECIVPRVAVSRMAGATSAATITSVKWRGLTLVVELQGLPDGAVVDLRLAAGDSSSSIAEMGRITGGAGKVILLVGDEDLEGEAAQLVVVSKDGSLLLQRATSVGQNR